MADPKGSVLVVDDDPAVAKVVGALLSQESIEALGVASGAAALETLAMRPFDVVISDLRMPGIDGMALLERIAVDHPGTPVVMLTAHGTVATAVEAMRKGAADFLQKPFDRDELLYVVKKALAHARHAEQRPSDAPAPGFVGTSPALRTCLELVAKAAASVATVLLRGESGTGKELAARAIHEQSARRAGPLVKLHCAALPDSLLESELFGYEKGAFTGAIQKKPGRVELAEGGTLFLDEIGDITPAFQVKLLRLLQEREYERLGGVRTLKADVRFVAATHRDLEGMVARGDFREDLLYRLNVIPIWMPPLRDRPEDVEPLARRFCAEVARVNGRQASLTDDALAALGAQSWPGNVRQLANFVERLVVLADGPVLAASDVARELARGPATGAAAPPQSSGPPDRLEERRRDAERVALSDALGRAGGNRALAARLLGVSRRTLYNKLSVLGLD